ncbi:transposase [Streptomyces sp. NBC_00080]|uniref:transposase n=1 Tax=unclassified Streptomyces TaxID=2593676 RepID=UPI001150A404
MGSGRPAGACCAAVRTSPTSSSRRCGTRSARGNRVDPAEDVDRQGEPAQPPRSGQNWRRPEPSRPTPLEVPHMARGFRHPRDAAARRHRRPLMARDRRIRRHRTANARGEGINRVIKRVARAAFGFRNADKQRLRTRCVTARRARGHLRTAQL